MIQKIALKDLDSHLFCPLPWVGAHIMPNGTFSYCCVQNQTDEELKLNGNLSNQTLEEARKNSWSNNLRKDLLNGIQNESCRDCWNLENQGMQSLRQFYHTQWFKEAGFEKDFEVNADGTLDDQKIIYWDVRQTNLCNMKCITCGPDYSSLWNSDILKSKNKSMINAGVIDAVQISKDNILDIIKKDIDKTYKFYFAGGEPLISPMHWAILEELVERKLFNVELAYNTNLLKLDYKGKNVIDYWKKFEKFDGVYIGCSIDAVGKRAEVIRTGTIWEKVNKNFQILDKELFYSKALNVTTSNMSIGGLRDTIEWAKSFQWYNEEDRLLVSNVVYYPEWLSINVLPQDIKEKVWKEIKEPLSSIKSKRSFQQIEAELWKEIDRDKFERLSMRFVKHIRWLNSIRNTNPEEMLQEGCPELIDWYNKYSLIYDNLSHEQVEAL